MISFEEVVQINEFISKVQDEINDKFYTNVPEKALILILKRYEEFKKGAESGNS